MGTFERYKNRLKRGDKLKCSRTGRYYHSDLMRPDGKGGYINIKYDAIVHPGQKTKYRKGPGWERDL